MWRTFYWKSFRNCNDMSPQSRPYQNMSLETWTLSGQSRSGPKSFSNTSQIKLKDKFLSLFFMAYLRGKLKKIQTHCRWISKQDSVSFMQVVIQYFKSPDKYTNYIVNAICTVNFLCWSLLFTSTVCLVHLYTHW